MHNKKSIEDKCIGLITIEFILKTKKFKKDKAYNKLNGIIFYFTTLYKDYIYSIKNKKDMNIAINFIAEYTIKELSKLNLNNKKYNIIKKIIEEIKR